MLASIIVMWFSRQREFLAEYQSADKQAHREAYASQHTLIFRF